MAAHFALELSKPFAAPFCGVFQDPFCAPLLLLLLLLMLFWNCDDDAAEAAGEPARRVEVAAAVGDGDRRDAHRFYESLGFAASHEGMKLELK